MARLALLIGVIRNFEDALTPFQSVVEDEARLDGFLEKGQLKPPSYSTSYYHEKFDTTIEVEQLKTSEITRTDLLKWLDSHLDKSPDIVLFYFSGHGIVNSSNTIYSRLPYSSFQFKSDQGENDFLTFKTLCSRLEQTSKTKSIVILDNCFSGAIVDRQNYFEEYDRGVSNFKPPSFCDGNQMGSFSSLFEQEMNVWRRYYSRCLQVINFYPNFEHLEEARRNESISIFMNGLGVKNRTPPDMEFNALASNAISLWKEAFKCKYQSAIKEFYGKTKYSLNFSQLTDINSDFFKSKTIDDGLRNKITSEHVKLINEYYGLSANDILSEEQSLRLSEILKIACYDKVFEFLVDEVDTLLMNRNLNRVQEYQKEELFSYSKTPELNNAEFFVGRSDCLQRLQQILNEKRLVLIHGVSGVGKTTLALRFAKQFRDNQIGSSQILFTSFNLMRGYSNLMEDITVISPGEVSAALVELEKQHEWEGELTNHSCLLILDGIDSISNPNSSHSKSLYSIDAIQYLLDNLTSKKQIQILLTSRMVETWIEQPYAVVELPEFINPGLDETCSKQLKEIIDFAAKRLKKSFSDWITYKHIQLVCEYYRLSLLPRLTAEQGEQVSKILVLAKHDRMLEFLCNEIDDILIQKNQ